MWAWVGVAVLVVAGAAVGLAWDKRATAEPGSNNVRHGVQVNVGGSSDRITVKSRSGTAGLTVGVLAIVATLAGMAAGAWLTPRPQPTASGGAGPAWAVATGPNLCQSGWVVPDEGQTSIPVPDGAPPKATLSSGGHVEVTFQGTSDQAAVLQSISVEVVRRAEPPTGIYLPGLCGSDVVPHFYGTDLDSPRPQVVPMPGADGGQTVPAREFSYMVGKNDVEKIIVTPTTDTGYVEWYLHVKWTSGDQGGDLRIDDGGKPFRTTSASAAKKWCAKYLPEAIEWVPPGPEAPCA